MIWAGLALLIALALGFLLPQVLRTRKPPAGRRADYDVAVYRDQLKELETDLARGTVTPAEAAEAKREIERRLLRAAPRAATERVTRSRIAAGPAVALGVPVIAVAIYLASGGHPPVAGGGAETAEFSRMAERLAAKLAENPDSPEERRLLGRTYMELGRYGEAANAFRQGQRLLPTDADPPTMLGEALVLNAENTVTPAAVVAFEQTLKLEPRHPIARYYLGLGRLQAGATREAFDQTSPRSPNRARRGCVCCRRSLPSWRSSSRSISPPLGRSKARPEQSPARRGRARSRCRPPPRCRRRTGSSSSAAWSSGWPTG